MEINKPLTLDHFQNSWPSYKKEYTRKPKKTKVTKTTQRQNNNESEDPEDVKLRNQRHMDVLRDLARLRDHYYSVYLTKLESKVAKQRKAILAREETLKKNVLLEEEKKRQAAHIVPHRLPKVDLKSDSEYLQKVPKSRYYHLVAVEELMKSRGLLKHKYEVDEFWKKARADQSFWVKPIPASISPDALTEHMLSRYSSQTMNSKPTIDQTVVPSVIKSLNPLPSILKKTTEEHGDEKEEEMDAMPPLVFPEQPKFPNLHSFNANFTKKRKSNASSIIEENSVPKPENVQHNRRKLSHHLKQNAYEVAVVNTAMSRRLLHRHIPDLEHHQPMSDITEMWCKQSDVSSVYSSDSKKKDHFRSKKKAVKFTKNISQVKANEGSLEPITEEFPFTTDEKPMNQPLSFDMMLTNENVAVKDAKFSRKVWVNYTRNDDDSCIDEQDESFEV